MKKSVKIRIILPDKNFSGFGDTIITRKQVNLDDSLREVILAILKKHRNHLSKYLNIDETRPIAIYLHSSEDNFKKYGYFGIPYTVNEDKSIKFLAHTESLYRRWTLKELEELVRIGVLTGSAEDLDVMLELAALENRRELESRKPVPMESLLRGVLEAIF